MLVDWEPSPSYHQWVDSMEILMMNLCSVGPLNRKLDSSSIDTTTETIEI